MFFVSTETYFLVVEELTKLKIFLLVVHGFKSSGES